MATYHVFDLLKTDHLVINPALRYREEWRFGFDDAREFFRGFADVTFDFDEPVEGLFICDGRQDWPRLSWVFGYLFTPSVAGIRAGVAPEVHGSVLFEIGGTHRQPVVAVTPLRSPYRPALRRY